MSKDGVEVRVRVLGYFPELPPLAMHIRLPETPAGRLEQVMAWLHNTDEDGNPDPLITPELAAKLLEGP